MVIVNLLNFFIRKGAHFGTYFLLGGSWFIGLVPRIKGLFLTAVVSWLAATGYAGLDEFHQMITGGRTPFSRCYVGFHGCFDSHRYLFGGSWFEEKKKKTLI